ncbi:Holliday junction endonuclease [Planomonospora venezuelensis]|uniref:Holliday junction resolvasome RuvABC endonuclease subunit n=1 Tax=Planomonospora venezuelensis TaxID=1999 RepID=A0A841D337_PLAVE|nr:Holliday junction endonuclease [Planomonospora venezuelensis]MBB5965082.1 Holliday junction resolvasome RuvABC endonuclease subunit [Planomonospora venezuelensis]GIN05000.1 hypothetical protein Pve01_66580 [Planomonospora venezuelensis]
MTAPRVLGVDPSLTATGIAHPDGHTERVTCGDLRGTGRLAWICSAVMGPVTTGVDLVVIEGPSYGSMSGAGHHEAAGLWWLIAYHLDGRGVPYAVIPPSSLKKYASGKGNATKADMRMALFQRTGMDLRDDNQVDAAWLRAAGMEALGHPVVDLPKAQRDALAKVAWPTAVAHG